MLEPKRNLSGPAWRSSTCVGSTASREAGAIRAVTSIRLFDHLESKLGLYERWRKEYTARILAAKADIMTRDSLHKLLRQKSKPLLRASSTGQALARATFVRYCRSDPKDSWGAWRYFPRGSFERDWRRQWPSSAALRSSPRRTPSPDRVEGPSPGNPLAEGGKHRQYSAPRLREHRRGSSSGSLAHDDLEALRKVCSAEPEATGRED